MIYTFDDTIVDTDTREVRRGAESVHVEPQVFDVLTHLIENRDRVVTKLELLDEVWGDRFVSESALTSRIKSARQVCGDDGRTQAVIRTVHGRGYRFVAELRDDATAATTGRGPGRPGRTGELLRLEAALGSVRGGNRQTVFVTGDAGIGKSTLLTTFLETIDQSVHVLEGRCLRQRGDTEPYFCLLDALGRHARGRGAEVVDLLERVAPSWLSQMPSLYDDETARRLERRVLGATPHRMLREGVEAVEELARHAATVLVLEDLHWADGCTLDVVEMLATRHESSTLLLVATARAEPGPAADVLTRLTAAGRAAELRLAALDESALGESATDWFEGVQVDATVVDALHRRSGGVPLFAREIAAGWRRDGRVEVVDGRVVATAGLEADTGPIPDSVRQVVELQLGEVDDDELAVLDAAAVAGVDFDGAVVARALGRDLEETERTLVDLSARIHHLEALGGTSWPDGTVSTRYAFTHDLFRQVTYDRITPAARVRLHLAVGQAIEGGHEGRLEERVAELARHFVAAGDQARAVEYLRRAGERAAARSAHRHALDLLTDALARVSRLAPGSESERAELRVRLALGPVLVATRGWFGEEVAENYERALELCEQRGPDCQEWALARYGLATVTELRGQYETTDDLLQPLVADETATGLRLEANELLACSTFHQGAFERSLRHARRVLERYDSDEFSVQMARMAEHPISACNSWASLAAWYTGSADESLLLAEAAITTAEQHLYALTTARVQYAYLHQFRGEPVECLRWADATVRLAAEQGFPFRATQADMLGGWAEVVLGDVAAGLTRLADGFERYETSTARLGRPLYLGLLAEVRLLAGEPDPALALCDDALADMATTTRTFFFEPEAHRLRARALADLERPAETVAAALDQAAATADRLASPPLRLRAALERLRLDVDAPQRRERTVQLVAELVAGYDGQAACPDVTTARDLLARPIVAARPQRPAGTLEP